MKRRYLIECGYVYQHQFLNTGIQRVVRNVILECSKLEEEYEIEIVPVILVDGKIIEIQLDEITIIKTKKSSISETIYLYFKQLYTSFKEFIIALFPVTILKNFFSAPKTDFGFNFLIYNIFFQPILIWRAKSLLHNMNCIIPRSSDVLILLDSSWHDDIWQSVSSFKKNGGSVVGVVYDLIPILHPQYCDIGLTKIFKKWFTNFVNNVDGFSAISYSVVKEVEFYMNYIKMDKKLLSDYFYLGANFTEHSITEVNIRDFIKSNVSKKDSYIIVSTIEPRKNHLFLLDTFDILWEKGLDVKLFFIGKVGWGVDLLIDRIEQHPLLNKNLYMWNNINDDELQYIYQNAKMLIFPSNAEGFGLPIIESLAHRLPVLASDIAVHREVGGNHIQYFDLKDENDLINQITSIENNGLENRFYLDNNFSWINWSDSAKMFLNSIKNITSKRHE